ncbi:hypothetical protein FRB97_002625, partial [Tulasnella sp. 331]
NTSGPTHIDLFPAHQPGLGTDHQFQAELRSDFFTYIVHSSVQADGDPPQLYASVSGRPYMFKENKEGVSKDMALRIPTKLPDLGKYDAWELKMLTVDSTLQKRRS